MGAPIIGINAAQTWTGVGTDVPGFGVQDVGSFDDTTDGYKEFVFGQVEATLQAIGNVMIEGPGGVWSRATTVNTAAGQAGGHGTRVGVIAGAAPANGYGWMQIYGKCSALTAGAVAVGTRLNTTATAGTFDDDGTVGARAINGAVFKTAAAGAAVSVDCRISYPTVGVTL
jgi:hypothetical protein